MTARNVRRGDHLAVLLPNNVEFVATLLAAADLGLTLIPLSPALTTDAIAIAFTSTRVKHVIATADTISALTETALFPVGVADGLWLAIDRTIDKADTFSSVLQTAPDDAQATFQGKDEDSFILTMTSGSTGDPKPIILTQRTKRQRISAAQQLYGLTSDDITLAATPLYHSLAERLVLLPLMTGGTSVLMARFSASEWLRHIAEHKVTFTIAVSSQLGQILPHLQAMKGNHEAITSLRCLVSSSARIDHRIKADLVACFDGEFHECYGASEIAIATNLSNRDAETKLHSVGYPAPGVDVKILAKDGTWAAQGEVGEILCNTPMLFGGYYLRDDLTQAAMHGEYFRTGDLGRLDEEGFLYFMGRTKELIISGGINIYPTDIESALAHAPGVLECAAFPVQDDHLGEVVGVALVPNDPAEFNLRQVRHHCAKTLADFQLPRKYFILDRLPRNPMGKIMKSALINEFGGINHANT
ncbi:long-chain-fatty-acid--CoA ligase FadD13 [Denitratisoma sp. agr-D3]